MSVPNKSVSISVNVIRSQRARKLVAFVFTLLNMTSCEALIMQMSALIAQDNISVLATGDHIPL